MNDQSGYTVTNTGPITVNYVFASGRRIELGVTSGHYSINGKDATEQEVQAAADEIKGDIEKNACNCWRSSYFGGVDMAFRPLRNCPVHGVVRDPARTSAD